MFAMNLWRTLILNQVTFGDITHQLWERTKIRQKIIITKNSRLCNPKLTSLNKK